jgi:site-specific DNA-methyltransferase (adenine-specific)
MIIQGDCLKVMPTLPAESIDAIVTDPPYGLSLLGKEWDHSVPGEPFWREALRVAKPGAHLLAFCGTRTVHRLACAIEDAGWEIREMIVWHHAQGFPKGADIAKMIDRSAGELGVQSHGFNHAGAADKYKPQDDRFRADHGYVYDPKTDDAKQWDGWNTSLRPTFEPIVMARKPVVGTVAANVQKYGTGALNIDACRIGSDERESAPASPGGMFNASPGSGTEYQGKTVVGRWPANTILDGSDAVLNQYPADIRAQIPSFFFCAKASLADRDAGCEHLRHARTGEIDRPTVDRASGDVEYAARGNFHPTVKSTELMRYLCRLVTQPRGIILDPFMGSGSTGRAAVLEGFKFVGIELDPEYITIAEARIQNAREELGFFYDPTMEQIWT